MISAEQCRKYAAKCAALGTKVNVSIQKEKESSSQVSVTVGKLGDPTLGAELARKIKDRVEGGSMMSTTRP